MFFLGQVIYVQYPGFKHYGIYIGNDMVIHNSKEAGRVEEVSISNFSDSKEIMSSSIESKTPAMAAENAKRYLGVPYSLFSGNCEHFARVVCGLKKESIQLQKYLIITASTVTFVKADNRKWKAFGVGAAIGTLLTPPEKNPIGNALIGGVVGVCLEHFLLSRNK